MALLGEGEDGDGDEDEIEDDGNRLKVEYMQNDYCREFQTDRLEGDLGERIGSVIC